MASRIALRPIALESVQNVLALALDFAVAGLSSSTYQLVSNRLSSFGLLSAGLSLAISLAVLVLMLSARFLIMRNILPARRQGRPPLRIRLPGDLDRRLLEPDVGHGACDDIADLRIPARLATSNFPLSLRMCGSSGGGNADL